MPFVLQKVRDDDLFFAREQTDGPEKQKILVDLEEHALATNNRETRKFRAMSSGEYSEDDITTDDELDNYDFQVIDQNSKKFSCDKDDENAHLCLRLPVDKRTPLTVEDAVDQAEKENYHKRHVCRYTDGECALCIDNYEVDDEVVWSDLECRHAFHKDCILQWLAKGKKRCPICRHWFVPGAKIEDQKKSHGDAWNIFAEMERRTIESTSRPNETTRDLFSNDNCFGTARNPSAHISEGVTSEGELVVSMTCSVNPSEPSELEFPVPVRKETDCTARTVDELESSSSHVDEFEAGSSSESQG